MSANGEVEGAALKRLQGAVGIVVLLAVIILRANERRDNHVGESDNSGPFHKATEALTAPRRWLCTDPSNDC